MTSPTAAPFGGLRSAAGAQLRDLAYEHIKEMIVTNELAPGTLLTIDDLVQRLAVSRTPVREALLRLQSEHLVEILPQRAIRIAEITPGKVQELFAVRELLECAAVEQASRAIPGATLDALEAQIAAAGRQVEAGQYDLYALSDIELHTQIRLHSGNAVLTHLLELIHDGAKRVRVFAGVYRADGNAGEVVAEHRAIVDAMRRRDAGAARQLLAEHLQSSTRRILAQLAAQEATSVPASRWRNGGAHPKDDRVSTSERAAAGAG